MAPIRQTHRTILWLASLAAAFIATHVPPATAPHLGVSDPILHGLGYAALGLVTAWRLEKRPVALASWRWIGWLAFLIIYAAVDELSQPWVGRSCELGDWMADACGAILGMTAVQWFRRRPTVGQ